MERKRSIYLRLNDGFHFQTAQREETDGYLSSTQNRTFFGKSDINTFFSLHRYWYMENGTKHQYCTKFDIYLCVYIKDDNVALIAPLRMNNKNKFFSGLLQEWVKHKNFPQPN